MIKLFVLFLMIAGSSFGAMQLYKNITKSHFFKFGQVISSVIIALLFVSFIYFTEMS